MTPGPTCKDSKLTGWPYAWECAFLASFLARLDAASKSEDHTLKMTGPQSLPPHIFHCSIPELCGLREDGRIWPWSYEKFHKWLQRPQASPILQFFSCPQFLLSHLQRQAAKTGVRSAAGLISSCQQLLYLWGHLGNHLKLEDGNKLK